MSSYTDYGKYNPADWDTKVNEELEPTPQKRPLPANVSKFFKEVEQRHWLNGGKRENWLEIEKLGKKWVSLAKSEFDETVPTTITRYSTTNGLISAYKRGALTLSIESDFYKGLFPDIRGAQIISESEAEENRKQLSARAIQLTILGRAREIDKGVNGIANIEYKILENGGWLVGFNKKEVILYFPLASEIMIKKLKTKRQ